MARYRAGQAIVRATTGRIGPLLPSGRFYSGRRWTQNLRTGGYVGMELKFLDTSRAVSFTAPTDAAGGEMDPTTMNCLNGVGQGSGESQRVGKKYTIKSIHLTGRVGYTAAADQADILAPGNLFVALVLDMQTNGAQLNSEDVFTNPLGTAGGAPIPLRDMERSTRYKVLKVWKLSRPTVVTAGTDGTNTNSQVPAPVLFEMYKKCNIPVECIGDNDTVADINDNSLHLIGYASSTNFSPALSYNCRIRYVG